MGINTHSNAFAAKYIWGLGTIFGSLLVLDAWGLLAAIPIFLSGAILFLGTGKELSRFGKTWRRNVALFVIYWGLVVIGFFIGYVVNVA